MTARSWTLRLAYARLPLSLNDRRARMVVWREQRNLRDRVRMLARAQQIPRLDAIHVAMHWTPATKRKRDEDNAVATLKSAIDGLRDYRASYRVRDGIRVLHTPAWTGIVADDDPEHVTWSVPQIHPPDPDLRERLVLVITERAAAS